MAGTPLQQSVKQLAELHGKVARRTAVERWLTGVEAEGQARVCQEQSQLACSPAAQWQATVGLHHQQALCNAVKQLMQSGNWRLQARLSSHPGWSSACSIKEQCVLLQSGKIHLCRCNGQTGWPLCGQRAASRSSEALLLCLLMTDSLPACAQFMGARHQQSQHAPASRRKGAVEACRGMLNSPPSQGTDWLPAAAGHPR